MPTHRRWAVAVLGAVAFLLGLVGIAVGAGIAIPYASKLGFTSMTATGLVCVLSGTVLLWCGGWAVMLITAGTVPDETKAAGFIQGGSPGR